MEKIDLFLFIGSVAPDPFDLGLEALRVRRKCSGCLSLSITAVASAVGPLVHYTGGMRAARREMKGSRKGCSERQLREEECTFLSTFLSPFILAGATLVCFWL